MMPTLTATSTTRSLCVHSRRRRRLPRHNRQTNTRETGDDNVEMQVIRTDDELSESVDNMLASMDSNHDGYIEWHEFLAVMAKKDINASL
ncbi:hypothetical protein J6590_019827 [Homalodisca vitripennis]|nr:hypothetical protein J6590_019827 [Homalodisca vitripennis]